MINCLVQGVNVIHKIWMLNSNNNSNRVNYRVALPLKFYSKYNVKSQINDLA